MIRSCFTGAQGLWESLSSADRTLWDLYAETCPKSGPLGPYDLTGRLVFLRNMTIALYLDARGEAIADVDPDPPLIPGWMDMQQVTVGPPVAPGTGFSITLINQAPEDAFIYSERSHSFNPGRTRFKGPFLSSTFAGASVVSGAGYARDFIGLTEGLSYFAWVRGVSDAAPHRSSVDYIVHAEAVTTAP
jgi:hypothetical protein